ncbi:hypothetical protein O6H91_21G006400 [Diphasiastrum complanatum]|uniref:Uncharacterized protein n=2 Tax=Diphasiastrum complanatum TaxID=34168 RepID=A0ACC2AHA7_DIPCM|nr:hypothetical protein O6H91_21G006300 [Diphasiastrum complanatum]KAJ7516960.1 hypothetical protein O6H91_21G006400 [Diphasiastrum complanatum]
MFSVFCSSSSSSSSSSSRSSAPPLPLLPYHHLLDSSYPSRYLGLHPNAPSSPSSSSSVSVLKPYSRSPFSCQLRPLEVASILKPYSSSRFCTSLAPGNAIPPLCSIQFTVSSNKTHDPTDLPEAEYGFSSDNACSTEEGSVAEPTGCRGPFSGGIDKQEGLLEGDGPTSVASKHTLLAIAAVLHGIGIPPSKVSSMMKNHEVPFSSSSASHLYRQIELLETYGVKSKTVALAIQQCPLLLFVDLEKSMKPLVELLEDLGLDSRAFLGKLIRYNPHKLITSAESTLQKLTEFCTYFQLSKEDIAGLVRKNPLFIIFSSGQMFKLVEYLKELGLSDEEVGMLIRSEPYILTRSVENSLKPKVEFLKELGVDNIGIAKIIKSQSRLFGFSIEQSFKPKIAYLKGVGFHEAEIAKLLSGEASILARSVNASLDNKVEFLVGLGFEMGSPYLCKALKFAHSTSMAYLQRRVDWFLSMGFSRDDIFLMLRANPNLLRKNEDRLQEKIDYLVQTMKYPLEVLVSYPMFLNLSLEKRIIPRHKVLKWLRSMELVKRTPSLSFFTGISDATFQTKYLDNYPECCSFFEGRNSD